MSVFTINLQPLLRSFAALSTLALAGCGSFHSELTVPAGETFLLGGDQKGAFTARARNAGAVPVTLARRGKTGAVNELGSLAPGQSQTLTFGDGITALVRNRTTEAAHLSIDLTGSVPQSMSYEKSAAR
jgi:hypothetical protein